MLKQSLCALCFGLLLAGSLRAERRVAAPDALKAVVKKTAPDYPPIARQMHVSGKVEVDVTIDSEGNVADVRIVSGNALLTSAVVSAVKKWKFAPFTSNGETTRAVALLDFDFKL